MDDNDFKVKNLFESMMTLFELSSDSIDNFKNSNYFNNKSQTNDQLKKSVSFTEHLNIDKTVGN